MKNRIFNVAAAAFSIIGISFVMFGVSMEPSLGRCLLEVIGLFLTAFSIIVSMKRKVGIKTKNELLWGSFMVVFLLIALVINTICIFTPGYKLNALIAITPLIPFILGCAIILNVFGNNKLKEKLIDVNLKLLAKFKIA